MNSSNQTITLMRIIPAPPHDVFVAWIHPEKVGRWLTPEGFKATEVSLDAVVDGRYRILVGNSAGKTHQTTGFYRELQPGSRLVMTWGESLLTVEFHATAEGFTELTLIQNQVEQNKAREYLRLGWLSCLDQLAKEFLDPAGQRNFILLERAMRVSADRLYQAWTQVEELQRWLSQKAEAEARVGGTYRLINGGIDEMPGEHICHGVYQELVPGRKIAKTWNYQGPLQWNDERDHSLVTVEFLNLSSAFSMIRLREEGPLLMVPQERTMSLQAWSQALEGLEAYCLT